MTNHMNSHESIHPLLPQAVAGVLAEEALATVERHADACPVCRREMELLRIYARGLQELPQPVVPARLMRMTKARLVRAQEIKAERGRKALTLALLLVFSWISALMSWLVVRTFTGGVSLFGMNLIAVGTWSGISAVLTWTTAGVAAVVMGKRRELVRRVL
ncbi:MAG TPA: zf-HC2 domain-containing protein [Bryobacteraceae bacterium]|jgi:hypothetical protein|nr:zf-HC2 domain-containing protein [Bryobacteraceae bacterium]